LFHTGSPEYQEARGNTNGEPKHIDNSIAGFLIPKGGFEIVLNMFCFISNQ
jgi:hypothetical protein